MVQRVLAESSENERLLEEVRDFFYELYPRRDDPFVEIQELLKTA